MSEFRSLEHRIREVRAQTVRKQLEEAALKRGKVNAEDIRPNNKHSSVDSTDPKPSEGEEKQEALSENLDELNKSTLGSYVKAAAREVPERHLDIDHSYRFSWDKHSSNPAFRKQLDKKETKLANRQKGIEQATNKLVKEEASPQHNPAQDEMKQKMAAQKAQVQKQKDQIKMQLAQEKASKQEQAMKAKAEQQLSKIKEDEVLDELSFVPGFKFASRLGNLHNQRYQRLSASGDLAKAEEHRKRAIEWKRKAYIARDNPERFRN